jgi:hypothetical protein
MRAACGVGLLLACVLLADCQQAPRPIVVNVGEARVQLLLPRGFEHVDNGGRHEFRSGDVRITLEDEGIATPESLASKFRAARAVLEKGRDREAIERLSDRDDPILAARDREDLAAFWREWNSVAYDPTRRTGVHLAPALDGLIERATSLRPIDGHTFAMFTVLQELDTMRFQISRIAPVKDSTSWWEARTWTRVAHTSPRRFASRIVDGRLILLDSGNYLTPEAETAFDELLSSIEPAEVPVRVRTASR